MKKKTKNNSNIQSKKQPKVVAEKSKNRRDLSGVRSEINNYALIILSNVIRAFSVYYFIIRYDFAPGGITGIATMLGYATKLNAGYFILALNAPLVILSFFFYSKSYSIKTMVGLLLGSGLLIVLENIDAALANAYPEIIDKIDVGSQTILAAVAGGVLSGIGLSMVFKAGGSNGGTEIIAGIIQRKKPQINVSWFISILDATVIVASFFVYDDGLSAVLLALVQVFCYSKVSDIILSGFKTAIKVEIITSSPEDLGREIMEKLGRGVTRISATGLYSHADRHLLVCLIRKRQLPDLYKLLKHHADSFAFTSSASEVIGRGFSSLGADSPKRKAVLMEEQQRKKQADEQS